MPEASYQFLTLNREQDTPEIGELREGEAVINLVSGRIWVGDAFQVPIELGKNSREGIISNASNSNFIQLDVTGPDDFPINVSDPRLVPPGTYVETMVLVSYAAEYSNDTPPTTYVNHTIRWHAMDQPLVTDPTPLETYSDSATSFIFKLYAFGPREHWFGKVIWADR